MSSFGSPSRSRTLYFPGFFGDKSPAAEAILLEPWVETTYVPHRKAFGGRARTLSTTFRDLKLFCSFVQESFGHPATMADLTVEIADQFFHWHRQRKKCHSVATPNRSRASLKGVWSEAFRRGLVDYPPVDIRPARVDRHMPTAWSMAELGRILNAARYAAWRWYKPRGKSRVENWRPPAIDPGVWIHTLIHTLYFTGLRKSALLTARTGDLDLGAAALFIRADANKDHEDQHFELPPEVVAGWQSLDVHGRGLDRIGDDWPYDRGPDGTWKTLDNWYRRCLVDAKLPTSRRDMWHKLRRTCATHFAASQGIEAARRLLGHSSITLTLQRYIDPRFLPRVNAAESLPKPIDPAPASVPFRVIGDAG